MSNKTDKEPVVEISFMNATVIRPYFGKDGLVGANFTNTKIINPSFGEADIDQDNDHEDAPTETRAHLAHWVDKPWHSQLICHGEVLAHVTYHAGDCEGWRLWTRFHNGAKGHVPNIERAKEVCMEDLDLPASWLPPTD